MVSPLERGYCNDGFPNSIDGEEGIVRHFGYRVDTEADMRTHIQRTWDGDPGILYRDPWRGYLCDLADARRMTGLRLWGPIGRLQQTLLLSLRSISLNSQKLL